MQSVELLVYVFLVSFLIFSWKNAQYNVHFISPHFIKFLCIFVNKENYVRLMTMRNTVLLLLFILFAWSSVSSKYCIVAKIRDATTKCIGIASIDEAVEFCRSFFYTNSMFIVHVYCWWFNKPNQKKNSLETNTSKPTHTHLGRQAFTRWSQRRCLAQIQTYRLAGQKSTQANIRWWSMPHLHTTDMHTLDNQYSYIRCSCWVRGRHTHIYIRATAFEIGYKCQANYVVVQSF